MSTELADDTIDLQAVTQGTAVDSGVPAEKELIRLVEATLDPERANELAEAREALVAASDSAALVDAAAVIGNFQRMTRIADGTGIPLDPVLNAISADVRDELGLASFGSADNTPPVGWLKRRLFRMLAPLMLRRLRKQSANA